MPHYDYRCQACSHEFEVFQQMSADPLRKCPECGKLRLERLLGGGGGILFRGQGFYQTDYKKSGSSGPACGKDTGSCGPAAGG
jgi:putative FmdB family regulatory protein